MKAKPRKYPLTRKRLIDALERRHTSLDDPGFCLACGLEHNGIEPDARKYKCEECGERRVYGAEELALMML